ncbi:MAG: hypothetical protein R3F05_16140 [Planctomycetota bacterium]
MTEPLPTSFDPDRSGRASPEGAAADARALSGHGADRWGGRWREMRGRIRAAWTQMQSTELDQVSAHREQLVHAIQRKTGEFPRDINRRLEQIERELDQV